MARRLSDTDALEECLGGPGSDLDYGDEVSGVKNYAESEYANKTEE